MTETMTLASWVNLEGCFNFRDLGGYRTADGRTFRTGQVFRSDGLQALTETDLDHLCGEVGLGLVIDLRSSDEVAEDGSGGIAERAEVRRVPLFERARSGGAERVARAMPTNMGELYFLMLQAAREPIVRVVEALAETDVPAVFHCAAGKDRTGVISSLLLSLVGVPEDTIVADYAFSRQNIDQINARLAESPTYQRWMQELPEGAYDADPAAMVHFLDRVRSEFGGMAGWAEDAGLGGATRERLARRLLR